MLLLFILSSVSANLVLLSSVTVYFIYERDRPDGLTVEEEAILVYEDLLKIEILTMVLSAFFGLIFGYLYEVWSRKKVLYVSFVLLAFGMILPEVRIIDKHSNAYQFGRILTAVFSQVIMHNPLLNDYIKKHNRGFASAILEIGELIGEIVAFLILFKGVD